MRCITRLLFAFDVFAAFFVFLRPATILLKGIENWLHRIEMQSIGELPAPVVIGIFAVLAVLVIVIMYLMTSPSSSPVCPKEIHRQLDGSLSLHPTGQTFKDMNEFQQWWNSSGLNTACPIPRLTGARETSVLVNPDGPMQGPEETYAKTPINKVDDYEFSRIFGIERGDEMVIPRQNFNMILSNRAFDHVNKPISSDARKDSYRGLVEGFTAEGDLTSEATARYGEIIEDEPDKDCRISREEKKIAKMVAKAYDNDPNYDPVVVKVGANQWEVNELIPKRRGAQREVIVEEKILDPNREAVDIKFRYPSEEGDRHGMIDPFFPPSPPLGSDHHAERDPYYGYVPGLERPFGPTFDHFSWT